MADLSAGWDSINSKVGALTTYKETSQGSKDLRKNKGNSLSESVGDLSTQLNKIKDQQKRFQKEVPTSMDQLLNLVGLTQGNSSSTLKYLRRKLLEAMVKMESKVSQIVADETIKVLGCSQEQTYNGIVFPNLSIPPIQQIQNLPVNEGIYIPVKSIDFMGNLKLNPTSDIGLLYYEWYDPSSQVGVFLPYAGRLKYPFNKMLNQRMDSNNVNRNYTQEFDDFYNGQSQQNLFDIVYTKNNDIGISGDFFRVYMLDKQGSQSNTFDTKNNKVGEFIKDYYSTIKFVDPVNITGALLNYSSNFINIRKSLTYGELTNEGKFEQIIARILGLCNDSRREIDVSGIAKIPELDGVDDSFFEFNEVDLRNLDERISNTQKGITKFESCGDVELPVDADTLVGELIEFRKSVTGSSTQQIVKSIEKIIDTYAENPAWKPLIPNGVDLGLDINKQILKDLPKAVAASILTPKVLLPVFVLLAVLEKGAKNVVNNLINTANNVINSANTFVNSANTFFQSGNTIGQQVDNIIEDATDFFKKFKTFCIEIISKINEEFLKKLYEIIKKDILNLLNVIIADITRSKAAKKYTIILRLVQLSIIVIQTIRDYRKCKSLIDDLLNLLNFINSTFGLTDKIPTALLPLTQLLPGKSPERAQLNTIELLEQLGMPTGPMPDGSPNLANQFVGAIMKGMDKEDSENGTIDAMVIVPPLTGGLLRVFGKSR
jgi:hypothetical protein